MDGLGVGSLVQEKKWYPSMYHWRANDQDMSGTRRTMSGGRKIGAMREVRPRPARTGQDILIELGSGTSGAGFGNKFDDGKSAGSQDKPYSLGRSVVLR